jgi:dienelactone hydrolase
MPAARLALLALVLTLRAPTRADDACLAGASALGDERAFVTLRSRLEATCPCATAKGRSPWRHCARGVLATTISDATLRGACFDAGKDLIKGADCGSKGAPCGRVPESGAVSCRVKLARACRDRDHIDQASCADLDFCTDAVEWTAGTCSDVRVPGAFGVGVMVLPFVKQSVVDPTQTRELDTLVWYPTTAGAGSIDGAYQGVLDAPLDPSGAPYPIVLFSHGSCGFPSQSNFLWPLVASRGFVVVAPPHPGNTIFEFPSCGSPQSVVASAQERPKDMSFVLDQMLALNVQAGSPFFGALDQNAIAMTGHSFGGYTTYLVATQDPRITVAVPLAPAVPGTHPVLTVPSLSMISTLDSYVNDDQVRMQYAAAAAPKYLVELHDTGHFAYSDGCFPSSDCNPPTTLTQDEAHVEVLRWVIPFLERYLKGDASFAAFFDPPVPPDETFEAAP